VAIPRVLSIAGSDSGGGAGIQADIKTITMLGGHAMTAITAITAQNTLGVTEILPVPAATVLAQIDAVAGDIGIDAIKIGMIGSAETCEALADRLRKPDLALVPVVFDPVTIASTGARLTDQAAMLGFTRLLSRSTVSTPNADELHALSGMSVSDVAMIFDAAAHLIDERGSGPILATGIPVGDNLICDLLVLDNEEEAVSWQAARIDTQEDHGTGCTLSSAIAMGLARGKNLQDAINGARLYVREAMLAAPELGAGHGPMGHGLGRAHFEA
jgi:hydroxymethylpyrimidine/phosphomethylpyrimidine kinase